MRTNLRLVLLAAIAGPILSLGVFTSATAADEMEHLTLVERATSDMVTDTGSKGDSVGDILTFANEIYDEADKTKVGSDNGWCVRTGVATAWECTFTVTLEDGQLSVEGPFYDGGDSVKSVTGGTGKYAKVRGEMKLHARDEKGSAYDFVFDLHH
jgi:Allene oxide cyclase